MADYERFITAVNIVKRVFSIDILKQEQLEALYNFVCRRDVFVNLPTGFGKSLVFQMAPFVVKELNLCENPIIIVVNPLVTLMQDQVTKLRKQGISAISLSEAVVDDDCCEFIFNEIHRKTNINARNIKYKPYDCPPCCSSPRTPGSVTRVPQGTHKLL